MLAPLPPEMWQITPEAIEDETLRTLYGEVLLHLREEIAEVPGFGVLQQMMVERIAFLYVWLRDQERQGLGALAGRNYKETLGLWMNMASTLHKDVRTSVDAEKIREHIVSAVSNAINGVFDTMHPDVADPLRASFADALEGADF